MNDSSTARSAQQIEAELSATREEMARTVDALVEQFQPSYQIEQAKQALTDKALDLQEEAKNRIDALLASARETYEAAREGDQEALKKVGIAVAGVVAVVGLVVVGIIRRR